MKRKFIYLLLVLLLIPVCVKADDYEITSYDINMTVNENNTFDIIETINAYFYTEKHGIYRTIPLINEVQRSNDVVTKNHALITNVSINDDYSTETGVKSVTYKIGNEDITYTGDKKYSIKYTYDIGNDPLEEMDELYFNLIGNDWDTTISNVTFKITMPKEFDGTKVGFSTGKFGTVGTDNVPFQVNGNVITGSYNGTLEPGEALTIRCELPEGYFLYKSDSLSIFDILSIFASFTAFIICFLIWKKYGNDEDLVSAIEFYPPEDKNSLEVAYIYKERVDTFDAMSLIIYLASKGYIKITDISEKDRKLKDNFRFIKIKDYDGEDELEKKFMESLFKNHDEVSKKDFTHRFYSDTVDIVDTINDKKNRYLYFEKKADSKLVLLLVLILLSVIIVTLCPMFRFHFYANAIPVIIISILWLLVFSRIFVISHNNIIIVNNKVKRIPNIVKIIICLLFGAGGCIGTMYLMSPLIYSSLLSTIVYSSGLVLVLGMYICLWYLPKRTLYGAEMLSKVLGFREFLETSEKEKLEYLVEKNPSYFYDILPYTYVLGISKKWIKKFEDIEMNEPEWFESYDSFDYIRFNTFMDHTMHNAHDNATSSYSSHVSSSGGSSGGGGFSGGGSGGGGGGSW